MSYTCTLWGDWDSEITRATESATVDDDHPIGDAAFIGAGDDHEVTWIPSEYRTHRRESDEDQGFMIKVIGHDDDSYVYLGGTGTAKINPHSEG